MYCFKCVGDANSVAFGFSLCIPCLDEAEKIVKAQGVNGLPEWAMVLIDRGAEGELDAA